MLTYRDFEEVLRKMVPESLKLEGDFYGWFNEERPKIVRRVAVLVDLRKNLNMDGYDAVVSHHKPYINVDLPVFVMHTPLDRIDWGTNYQLSRVLGLAEVKPLNKKGLGVFGHCDISFNDALFKISNSLGVKDLRFGRFQERFKNIAVFSGCGLNYWDIMDDLIGHGIELFVSGDLTHHFALSLEAKSISFIDAGHYYTELPGIKEFVRRLNRHVEAKFIDSGAPYDNICIS